MIRLQQLLSCLFRIKRKARHVQPHTTVHTQLNAWSLLLSFANLELDQSDSVQLNTYIYKHTYCTFPYTLLQGLLHAPYDINSIQSMTHQSTVKKLTDSFSASFNLMYHGFSSSVYQSHVFNHFNEICQPRKN